MSRLIKTLCVLLSLSCMLSLAACGKKAGYWQVDASKTADGKSVTYVAELGFYRPDDNPDGHMHAHVSEAWFCVTDMEKPESFVTLRFMHGDSLVKKVSVLLKKEDFDKSASGWVKVYDIALDKEGHRIEKPSKIEAPVVIMEVTDTMRINEVYFTCDEEHKISLRSFGIRIPGERDGEGSERILKKAELDKLDKKDRLFNKHPAWNIVDDQDSFKNIEK